MARTDIHSPKNLITEDYDFLGAYDSESSGEYRQRLIASALRLGTANQRSWANTGNGGCDHCGANIRYIALMLHTPTDTLLRIGETCLDNRFSRASVDFQALRKAADLDRAAHRIRTAVAAFTAEHPEIVAHLEAFQDNSFYADLLRKLNTYGDLSERQVEAVARNMENIARRNEPAPIAPTIVPVAEGDGIAITGIIVSVRWQENDFGGAMKMLVADDRGFKVWGTRPAAIGDADTDTRVTFTANVTRSKDDAGFGFFNRPRQARIQEVN